MKLDFLICGTNNDAFCSQIAFFRMCLDHLGGYYKSARVVATLGDHDEESIPDRWIPYFKNIEIEWSHPVGVDNPDYQAQHYRRFEIIRPDADMAFICDADTALMKTFDRLLDECAKHPAIYGVIAHYPTQGNKSWAELSQATINKPISTQHRYTLLPENSPPQAPFYINYGMLAGTPGLLRRLYKKDKELIARLSNLVDNYWAPQVCIPLAVEDLQLPAVPLPMRYNYPNDHVADELYPEELDNVVLMHYLRHNLFCRHKIFVSNEEFEQFINMSLTGSNLVFQQHVKKLTDGEYPFQ